MAGPAAALRVLRQGGDVCGGLASGELGALVALARSSSAMCCCCGGGAGGADPALSSDEPLRTPTPPHEAPAAANARGSDRHWPARDRARLPAGARRRPRRSRRSRPFRDGAVELHLDSRFDADGAAAWLSIATSALGGPALLPLRRCPPWFRAAGGPAGPRLRQAFDAAYIGLVRFAAAVTRALQHGRLELYLLVVFLALRPRGGGAAAGPGGHAGAGPFVRPDVLRGRHGGDHGYRRDHRARWHGRGSSPSWRWACRGWRVSMLYLLFGAPDVSFTQFMVEILSVVILTLVMTRLRLDASDPRPLEDWMRDGVVALFAGTAITMLLLAVLEGVARPQAGRVLRGAERPQRARAQRRQRHPGRLPRPRHPGRNLGGDDRRDRHPGADPRGRRRPQAAPAKARTRRNRKAAA